MLWTLVMALLCVWLLGLATSTTGGGLIYVLPGFAAVLMVHLWVRKGPIRGLL